MRGAVLGAALLLVGLGLTGRQVVGLWGVRRSERAALRSTTRRHLPYVIVPDVDGSCVLLLFETPTGPPRHVLVLAGEPVGRIPASGTIEVRGRYEAGEVVAAVLSGVEVPTLSPLLELDADTALATVNGVPLDDDTDDPDDNTADGTGGGGGEAGDASLDGHARRRWTWSSSRVP